MNFKRTWVKELFFGINLLLATLNYLDIFMTPLDFIFSYYKPPYLMIFATNYYLTQWSSTSSSCWMYQPLLRISSLYNFYWGNSKAFFSKIKFDLNRNITSLNFPYWYEIFTNFIILDFLRYKPIFYIMLRFTLRY